MTKRRHDDDFYASGGRQRGEYKSEEEKLSEDKAKGHTHQDQGEMPGEELEGAPRSRGLQKGYGKNQGKESPDWHSPHNDHSIGGFHN